MSHFSQSRKHHKFSRGIAFICCERLLGPLASMQASEGAASDFFEDDEEDFGLGGPGKHN